MNDPKRNRRDEKNLYDEDAEMREWREWAEKFIEEEGGAGEEGSDELVKRYKKDTPGQTDERDL